MVRQLLLISLLVGTWLPLIALEDDEFSHKYHEIEEELECSECHHHIYESTKLENIESWTVKSCEDCHDDPVYDSSYHFKLVDTSYQIPYRAPFGTVKFSHKQHIDEKIDCQECHGDLDKIKVIDEDLKIMKDCMECHVEKADNSCTSCHYDVRVPANHKMAIWDKAEGHGWESAIEPENCETCHHQKNSCTACHLGATDKKIHPANYRWTHGVDVYFKSSDCSTCHQPEIQFCGDCHAGVGND